MIPVLQTPRLILRAPVAADFAAYAETLASPRADHIGGPCDRREAWLDFCQDIASWHLRGYGAWTITETPDDTSRGTVMLHHEVGDPERELGWILHEGAEGRGLATEAATAARDFAFDALEWGTFVSYIAPENHRSIRVAERLGATLDPDAAKPVGYPDCLIYRHTAGAA